MYPNGVIHSEAAAIGADHDAFRPITDFDTSSRIDGD